jgi:DNA-binding NtrC family response regulator
MLEDAASKNGTFLNSSRVTRAELADGDIIEAGHIFFVFRNVESVTNEGAADVDGVDLRPPAPGLATLLPRLAERFARLDLVAPSSVSLMLQGESGTGKEVVARAVHLLSRRPGDFVAVNCGALPPTLVESELFGHKKGAFSGAIEDRPGLVRAAHRGTLFLDEVGDLPVAAQPAFLRVLQEGEVVPVGSTQPVRADVRLVSATHRDLDALVAEGGFRADLLARLRGLNVNLLALRDRREEIGLLVADLLTRLAPERARDIRFAPEAGRALVFYDWPLNIRELEKCLGAAIAIAGDGHIKAEHLPEHVQRGSLGVAHPINVSGRAREQATPGTRLYTPAEESHRDELAGHLRAQGGNISAVARSLGKARVQIQRWVKRYGLDPESFRSR